MSQEISIESTSGWSLSFYTRPHDRGLQVRIVNPNGFTECFWNIMIEDFTSINPLTSLVAYRRDILRNVARRGFTSDERSSVDRLWFAHIDAFKS